MNEISPPERSLATLFTDLTRETGMLFRQEVQLAKAEITEKIGQAGNGLIATAVGAVLLLVGFQALVAAAILALALVLDWWAAALIIGAVLALIGGIALARGLASFRRSNITPRRTLDTLRANARWAREQMP